MITELKTSPQDKQKQFAMPSRAESSSEPTLLMANKTFSQDDDDVKQKDYVPIVALHPLTPGEASSAKLSSSLGLVSLLSAYSSLI